MLPVLAFLSFGCMYTGVQEKNRPQNMIEKDTVHLYRFGLGLSDR